MAKLLRQYDCNEIYFNKILTEFDYKIICVSNNNDKYRYFYGTRYVTYDTDDFYYFTLNGEEYIVMQEYYLDYLFNCAHGCSMYTQIVIHKNNFAEGIEKTYSGKYCYDLLMKYLQKYYTKQEIKDILNSYTNKYDTNLKQKHYSFDQFNFDNTIYKITNVYKYDINGAHQDALIEMFPKAKPMFDGLEKLKTKDNESKKYVKSLFNLFVGYMKHEGYEGAYNWVVQRTTKKLLEAIEYCDGELLYANTDGFAIKNPKHLINNSKNIGEFKLEYKGDIYFYRTSNYFQFGYIKNGEWEYTGSSMLEIRPKFDFLNGVIVEYKKVFKKLDMDENNASDGYYIAEDVQFKKRKIKEY